MARLISTQCATKDATEAASVVASQLLGQVDLAQVRGGVIYATIDLDLPQLRAQLLRLLPGVPFIGSSSCAQVASDRGLIGPGIVALWFCGDGFRFGVATGERRGDFGEVGRQLLVDAAAAAAIAPEHIRFVIVHTTPGEEERFIRGLYQQLDAAVPIIGGSAADNDLSGRWSVFSSELHTSDGAVVAVCDWPWKLSLSFQSGYLVTKSRGTVTRASGRVIHEIDGRPAAEVYDEWTGGKLAAFLDQGGSVLDVTTLGPLGIPRGRIGGIDAYVLVHPEQVRADDHALTTFADVEDGDEVVLMRSTRSALIQRGGKVAQWALDREGMTADQLAGALFIYCAGCMLAIEDQLDEVLDGVAAVLPEVPMVMPFTFGELGCVYPRRYDHGNLMLGVLLLATSPT